MGLIVRKDYSGGWYPSADSVNCPPNVFLRADNLIWDETGIPSLRPGSAKINSVAFADTSIHSLHSALIGGTKYRFAGANNAVYMNGTSTGTTFAGSGDIAFGSHMGQVLYARSTTKKKHDGTTERNWGIAGPGTVATVAAKDAWSKTFATCDSTESPAFTAEEGTITATFPTGEDGTANGSIELTPSSSTARATIRKDFSSDQNFFDIQGFPGGPNDLFDMSVWMTEPEKVQVITVMIGVGSGSDSYQTDHYYFDWNLGGTRQSVVDVSAERSVIQNIISPASSSSAPRRPSSDSGTDDDGQVTSGTPSRTPLERTLPTRSQEERIERIEERRDERTRARERKDKASNPGWTHLVCTRGQFNRVGSTVSRDWSTVKSIKLIYKAESGATGTVRFDSIVMKGNSEQGALVGPYRVRYRYVNNNGTYYAKSPASGESALIRLNGQGIRMTITAAELQAMDSQVNEIWPYIHGGTLDRYYRAVDAVSLAQVQGIRMDEFPPSMDGTISQRDRIRLAGSEFSLPVSTSGGVTDVATLDQLTIDINTNDAALLTNYDYLEPSSAVPPDNIIGVAGPHYSRTLVLTSGGLLYPSFRNCPDTFRNDEAIRVGDNTETPYWVVKTFGGIFVGTSKDIYAIEGDGEELPDGTLNFTKQGLNINSPPISAGFASDGNFITYLATDGWRTFNGTISALIPNDPVELLFRGYTRYGVSSVNLTTGRHRAAINKGQLVAVTPEGASTNSSQVLYRLDFKSGGWYRHTYPNAFAVIHREPDGTLIAGDTSGLVWTLDTGTQDGTTDIAVVAWTPVDCDGTPLNRKDPFDFSIRSDVGSGTLSVAIHLDGSGSVATNGSFSVTSNGILRYKRAISDVTSFRDVQLRMTGSFSTFKLYDWSLGYRMRPQTVMFLDTGYMRAPGSADRVWCREIEFMANTPNNLTVTPYMDDTAGTANTVTATANKTTVYSVKLAREVHGTAPRVTFATTNSAGTSEVGFEIYWIRLKGKAGGNETEKPFLWVAPELVN